MNTVVTQVPSRHACVEVHALPQAPQWLLLLPRSASQPSTALPLQLPKPVLHAMAHAPPVHDVDALGRAGHAAAQAPQLLTLVARSVSQPLVATPSQSPRPVLQRKPQVDEAQVVVAPVRAGQALRQAPQLATSVVLLISQPSAPDALQSVKPGTHAKMHAPVAQAPKALGGSAQALPHVPQFERSMSSVAQVPEQFT